jgi:hypothetical protein
MTLSREDAELMIGKYLEPDAPEVFVVFLSRGFSQAMLYGRLSKQSLEQGTVLAVKSEAGGQTALIAFLLDPSTVRYSGTIPAPPGLQDDVNRRFEGALSLTNVSGDRFYIYEPKPV